MTRSRSVKFRQLPSTLNGLTKDAHHSAPLSTILMMGYSVGYRIVATDACLAN